MVESEKGVKKITRKSKLLPKYLEKTKIDEMLEKVRNDNKRNYLTGNISKFIALNQVNLKYIM
jgi:hypothetical protein